MPGHLENAGFRYLGIRRLKKLVTRISIFTTRVNNTYDRRASAPFVHVAGGGRGGPLVHEGFKQDGNARELAYVEEVVWNVLFVP